MQQASCKIIDGLALDNLRVNGYAGRRRTGNLWLPVFLFCRRGLTPVRAPAPAQFGEVRDVTIFATPVNSDLIVLVQTGTDAEGNPVYARVRYSALKPGATDQDAYDVAAAIGGLQQYPVAGIQRQNVVSLVSA